MNIPFTKENVTTTKGMQPSQYDAFLPHFVEKGDTLYFDEKDLNRIKASMIAKRLMVLDPTKKFHSGFNAVKGKVYIRLRLDGEVPDASDKKDSSEADAADAAEEYRPSDENGNPTNEIQKTLPFDNETFEANRRQMLND